MSFQETAIELRNITHTFESDYSLEALLKKKPIITQESQPKINVNHHNLNNGSTNYNNFNSNVNSGLNGGLSNGHYLNNNNLGYTSNLNNNNNNNEEVQMIYLNQSKNFPSFYFKQNENNSNEDYINRLNHYRRSRSSSADSFNKKLFSQSYYSKKNVLNNLDMTVPKGSIYGLLGPSGCGKTTLLKIITGVIKPNRGTVNVFNCDPYTGKGNIPGSDVGYMPQDFSLHEDLTIGEMLYYFGRIYRMDRQLIKIKIKELVRLMDLPGDDQIISSLSGGQKRRASFCCAIIHIPK